MYWLEVGQTVWLRSHPQPPSLFSCALAFRRLILLLDYDVDWISAPHLLQEPHIWISQWLLDTSPPRTHYLPCQAALPSKLTYYHLAPSQLSFSLVPLPAAETTLNSGLRPHTILDPWLSLPQPVPVPVPSHSVAVLFSVKLHCACCSSPCSQT